MDSEFGLTFEYYLTRIDTTSHIAIEWETVSGHVIFSSVAGAVWDTEMPFVVTVWSVIWHTITGRYQTARVANPTTAHHEIVEMHESYLARKMHSNQNDSGCYNDGDNTRLDEKEEVA